MVLFQLNFYTDTCRPERQHGRRHPAVAAACGTPCSTTVMGVLADRTNTRWGKFRPWVLWTAAALVRWSWSLAYTTPDPAWGWSTGMVIAYAGITNTLLMTLYSMNNMPYSALGGVMTGRPE